MFLYIERSNVSVQHTRSPLSSLSVCTFTDPFSDWFLIHLYGFQLDDGFSCQLRNISSHQCP